MKKAYCLLPWLLLSFVLSGCSPPHEENVRKRAKQFVSHLLQEDYAACAELTDPAFIRQHGLNGAEIRYKVVGAFLKLGQITEEKVKIGTITVDAEANTATVNVSIKPGEEWKEIDPQKWVLVEGEWYLKP